MVEEKSVGIIRQNVLAQVIYPQFSENRVNRSGKGLSETCFVGISPLLFFQLALVEGMSSAAIIYGVIRSEGRLPRCQSFQDRVGRGGT